MKKENKFIIAVVIIAIIALTGVIFFTYKYPIYKANKDAESIEVGDNEELEATSLENIEQDIIHYEDEIGTLTIPDILLDNAPIRESVELTTLSETIGHFPSTSIYEGNVGLASHNSGSNGDFFKNLKNIKMGSEIYYQTNYGTKRYVVTTKDNYDLTSATLEVTITDSKIGEIRTITNNINISNNMSNTVKVDNVSDGDIIELKLINVKSGDTIIKDLTASDKFIY